MNLDRFAACLASLWPEEGGYSNNPHDHGGETNLGVTDTLDGKADHMVDLDGDGKNLVPIRTLTREQAGCVYLRVFWAPSHAGDCPEPLDRLVFEVAVNSGVGAALRNLQRSLGTTADGRWGANTAALVKACDPTVIGRRFLTFREAFFRDLVAAHPDQERFLAGWLSRLGKIRHDTGLR